MKILIICTGNSCRSQMAHGFLQSFDNRLKVFSAGTKASGKVSHRAIQVMKEVDIDISHHSSDSVILYLDQEWDYLITVCDHAKKVCPPFNGKVKHRIHIAFDDPYEYVGSEEYKLSQYSRVRDEIKETFYKFYIEKIVPQL